MKSKSIDMPEGQAPRVLNASDCASCGACCREAYHVVEIDAEDPFTQRFSQLLVVQDGRWTLPRPGGHCVCLSGDGEGEPFLCGVYAQRPQSCVEFEVGGENCLDARARTGVA